MGLFGSSGPSKKELTQRVAAAAAQNSNKDGEINQLRGQVQALQAELQSRHAEAEQHGVAVALLESELDRLRHENVTLQRDSTALREVWRRAHEDGESRWRAVLEQANAEMFHQAEHASRLEAEVEELRQHVSGNSEAYRARFEQRVGGELSARLAAAELQAQRAEAESALGKRRAVQELEELRKAVRELQGELERKSQEVDTHDANMEFIQQQAAALLHKGS